MRTTILTLAIAIMGSGLLAGQSPEPQIGEPKSSQPQIGQPQISEPQVGQPKSSEPQLSQPQIGQPQSSEPNSSQPQIGHPQSSEPQIGDPQAGQAPLLRSQTTEVLVPALVLDREGKLVYTLKAEDFRLTDDGVAQKLTLAEETGAEPLALVVLVEVGGAGARQFQRYDTIAPPLGPMLTSLVGNVRRQVAVVTFDSSPKLLQEFTPDLDEAREALESLQPGCTRQNHFANCGGPHPLHDMPLGDNGAAILDSVEYAVRLLGAEAAGYRRAILLVSETLDRGSETTVEQAVRDVTAGNVIIYSVAYSTAKSETSRYAHHQLPTVAAQGGGFENPQPNPPHGCMGREPHPDADTPTNRWVQAYDCLAQLAPPLTFAKMAAIATVDGLKRNVPETLAQLTGGEYYAMKDAGGLERGLAAIANHVPNRYYLSFHPQAPHAGPHVLKLTTPEFDGLAVTSRGSYWADGK